MRAQLLAQSLIAFAGLACASTHSRPRTSEPRARADSTLSPRDTALDAYERHGLIALPFWGIAQCFFLAGATPDSTRMIFSVSFPGAGAEMLDIELLQDTDKPVHSFYVVHTAVFQETITLAPGRYHLTMGGELSPIIVPRLGPGSIATPIPVLDSLRVRPRATAYIGRDTAIAVYLEAYGSDERPIVMSAPGWRETVRLERHGDRSSGTVQVPLSRLGPGETTLLFTRGRDTVTTPVFVGVSVYIVTLDEVLGALRYLAPAERLDAIRHASADERPRLWTTFMARYRSRLSDYFDRVREANRRYSANGTPGWETDRGGAYMQLGDPDQVFVEPDIEIWVYTRYFGRLKFDHKRLTPESHAMLETLIAQARSAR